MSTQRPLEGRMLRILLQLWQEEDHPICLPPVWGGSPKILTVAGDEERRSVDLREWPR